MWANQTAVVQPRLIPSQLPWGLKHSSSSSGIPIVSLWANKIGISSTRSVVTVNGSVISTAYRIFKILSPFDRTMSYRGNFTEKACKLFDEVQKSGADYNQAVSEAKDPVTTILNTKIDTAFREWAKTDDFKRWKEETNGGGTWSAAQYHGWNAYIYQYMQRPSSTTPEAQALVWAYNILGWVLANDIDKASGAIQKTYENDFQARVTPDTAWFKSILESVWPDLQELPHVKKVHEVATDLFAKTVQAKDYVQSRLTYIRDNYEG